jgi:hypothetical protein
MLKSSILEHLAPVPAYAFTAGQAFVVQRKSEIRCQSGHPVAPRPGDAGDACGHCPAATR